MESVIFVGIPGSGKSSFYKERFFSTHVRISLDLLRTRFREKALLQTCLDTGQCVVIDNTNPAANDRKGFIEAAKRARYAVVGYYFQSQVEDCIRRNDSRQDRVPEVAIRSAAKRLELPTRDEGFDQLFYVRLNETTFEFQEFCE